MAQILDWNKYLKTAAQTVAEGIVMVKNDNHALPINKTEEVSVFGRIQMNYYKSGTGSGGMVNVSKVTGIIDGLKDCGANLNKYLLSVYEKWIDENPFDLGEGWGAEPWCQQEMPLDDTLVKKCAETSDTAIVIIGRTAGEEQDNKLAEGSYLLTALEKDMLAKTRKYFKKVAVLLNVGNIIDMSFVDEFAPDAVLYVWQGGMTGGTGTAKVLLGETSPCGKLPDTVAYSISDYPSDKYFGDTDSNVYTEDIYVGYRYFETFAKDKVRYPFGFGLSYTDFEISCNTTEQNGIITVSATVKNTGSHSGKEVVQVYCEAPQGRLGKPSRVLCGYEKTPCLAPNESRTLEISIDINSLASYDDGGVTENRFAWVLEQGDYNFYAGTDVRRAQKIFTYTVKNQICVEQLGQALAPVEKCERFKPAFKDGQFTVAMENTPLSEVDEEKRRLENLPEEIPQTGDKGIKLSDVVNGVNSIDEFISQLSDYDLSCIVRGEGMCSPKVTAGTAAAFGGVSKRLTELEVPCGCCSDGPSGMRLDCGTKAFSLPNGTLIASTFNKELVTELFNLMGLEMSANKVECLLGPGMNIHRHPLNGRNFEYFSEDPFLTGTMACAELDGMHSAGVTGTIKHFCGNNQETNRHFLDTVVSERALREIYLKGFEIAVKQGNAKSIMTTYGKINGLWTAGSFDLNTEILRKQWGYTGFTMTDWWANINDRGKDADKSNFAAMVKAHNDVYMVCADSENHDDNIMSSLENGTLKRSELQRNAKAILSFLMETRAMKRIMGKDTAVEIVNRPADASDIDAEDVKFYKLDKTLEISLEDICTDKGKYFSFALDIVIQGVYKVTLTASSTQSGLAQIPVTLFSTGTAYGTMTWNGTDGKPVSFCRDIPMFSRFTTIKLYFALSGLKMHSIKFELLNDQI